MKTNETDNLYGDVEQSRKIMDGAIKQLGTLENVLGRFVEHYQGLHASANNSNGTPNGPNCVVCVGNAEAAAANNQAES